MKRFLQGMWTALYGFLAGYYLIKQDWFGFGLFALCAIVMAASVAVGE